MRRKSTPFVRKTVSLDADILPIIHKIRAQEMLKTEKGVFLSGIINEILKASTFKNLDKYNVPRSITKRTRITLVVDIDIHKKIVEQTANAIETCAINYCGEPSKSYSRILNNALRKGLHL